MALSSRVYLWQLWHFDNSVAYVFALRLLRVVHSRQRANCLAEQSIERLEFGGRVHTTLAPSGSSFFWFPVEERKRTSFRHPISIDVTSNNTELTVSALPGLCPSAYQTLYRLHEPTSTFQTTELETLSKVRRHRANYQEEAH